MYIYILYIIITIYSINLYIYMYHQYYIYTIYAIIYYIHMYTYTRALSGLSMVSGSVLLSIPRVLEYIPHR
jgi:hypothetical protein